MDIMKIKTKFMRGIVAKLISMTVHKKFGYKIDVNLEDIDIQIDDVNAHVHINVDVDMKVDDLKTFTKFIESED